MSILAHTPFSQRMRFPEILNQNLNAFDPISLAEMDQVKLLNRIDTKFIIPRNKLFEILSEIKDNYSILEIDGKRFARYNTLYFDTEEFSFYKDHYRKKPNRFKVRIRKYLDSSLCFLEVKHKKKGRTIKSRMKLEDIEEELSEISTSYLKHLLPNEVNLEGVLWNKFERITLVNKHLPERLTLDLNLGFSQSNNDFLEVPEIVICELKQEQLERKTPFYQVLKSKGIRPSRMSKYCIGAGYLYTQLKTNRFKPKYLQINKLTA